MRLLQTLLLLFLLVPLIEIYLLIQVGSEIGAMYTVLLVVLTAVLGAGMLRWQGLTTMRRVQGIIAQGEVPAIEMMEGVLLLLSGALLLTPGFFTDAIGFLCLVPSFRRAAVIWFVRRKLIFPGGGPRTGYGGNARDGKAPQPRTLEGEFWEEKDKDKH